MMKPKHTRITDKLKKIARHHGMRVRFREYVEFGGSYSMHESMAVVKLEKSSRTLISTFFHELGHHIDYTSGVYKNYYNVWTPLYEIKMLALRAERHADMVGERLCNKYFPDVKYERSYRTESDIEYLRKYYE